MTDEEMLAHATAFTLIRSHPRRPLGHLRELKVELRSWDPDAWAIVGDDRSVLNREGLWEYEPMPSSRTDEFRVRTRWPAAREAIQFAQSHMQKYPTGYAPEDQ